MESVSLQKLKNDGLNNGNEIVAVGDLYKITKRFPKQWFIGKFFLSGQYLTYTDSKGLIKGRINISGCTVRRLTPEDCSNNSALFAFGLYTNRSNRRCLLNASNEKVRTQWITVLESQIDQYDDYVRRFLFIGETIIGSSTVKRKNEILTNITKQYNLVLTNYPRFLLIHEPTSLSPRSILADEIIFSIEDPPIFIPVSIFLFFIDIYQIHTRS